MPIKPLILSLLLATACVSAQTVSTVYKINGLLHRIDQPDTLYVLNFWATWCKPCVQELPAFDSLNTAMKHSPVKVLLVSLDFKEDIDKKVNPFLKKNNYRMECDVLDEVNGNDFINKISAEWSGAIPATLFTYKGKKQFAEKKMTLNMLQQEIKRLQ